MLVSHADPSDTFIHRNHGSAEILGGGIGADAGEAHSAFTVVQVRVSIKRVEFFSLLVEKAEDGVEN